MKSKLALHICVSVLCFLCMTGLFFLLCYDAGDASVNAPETVSEPDTEVVVGKYVKTVGNGPEIVRSTDNVSPGEKAELRFRGVPGNDYDIFVYYPSGKSGSSVFQTQTADYDGYFGWEWTVPGSASSGKIRIVLRGEDCYVQFYITVV